LGTSSKRVSLFERVPSSKRESFGQHRLSLFWLRMHSLVFFMIKSHIPLLYRAVLVHLSACGLRHLAPCDKFKLRRFGQSKIGVADQREGCRNAGSGRSENCHPLVSVIGNLKRALEDPFPFSLQFHS
jgi:hypothetical protein